MKAQARHHRVAGVPGDELAVMRLLAKVEVGVDGVFQQMHHAIAGHDEDRPQPRTQTQALGRHLQQRRGHQEAGAQGHKVAQITLDAAGTHQNQPPATSASAAIVPRMRESFSIRAYPLCRMCITSPSCTTYSLPSRRRVPLARAAASEPASSRLSQRMVSARMK